MPITVWHWTEMPTGTDGGRHGAAYNGDELLYLMAADRMGRDEHVPGLSAH